jgi:hypothetical protein
VSKRETPMTEAFWQQHARGAFIPEYCIVRRAGDCGGRYVDALILPDEPHRSASFTDYPALKDRNVIVVQTKAERMGMYLMGQALFSARLALARGAKSARSILLCTAPDSALLPLLKDFPEVEVWVYDERSGKCRRAATS